MNDVSTARIISQSAPLTPRVYLLTGLAELRDLPKMLRHAGDFLHKIARHPSGLVDIREAAAATLAYQFGWKPLIEDISRMLDFAKLVEIRQRDLLRLYTTGSVRKKVKLGKRSYSASGNQALNTTGGLSIWPNWQMSLDAELWATVRWSLRDPTQIGRLPNWWDSFRSVYGLNAGQIPVQVWKALPWSWAIDWFADISNLLNVGHNMVMFKPDRINIMCHTRGWTYWKPYSTASTQWGGCKVEYDQKWRQVRSIGSLATTSLRVPLLDPFKLSVLGSLGILKLLGNPVGMMHSNR
jgi:hypothetical protein